MRMNSIESINTIVLIQNRIAKDISTLKNLVQSNGLNSQTMSFLNSLLSVKQKLKAIGQEFKNDNYSGVGSPPQKLHLSPADLNSWSINKDQVQLLETLLESEREQQTLVKSAMTSNGIPDALKIKLEEMLTLYEATLEHLMRSKSTQQLGVFSMP